MAVDYTESFTLLGIGLVFILVRIYVRWTQVGPSNFQLDDYFMPLAGIIFAVEVSLAYLVGARYGGFTNSYMTPEQRASLDPNSDEYHFRIMGSKIQVAGWNLYAMVLWLIKGSLAVFYSRLTTGLSHLPTRVRFAYILLGVTYLGVALTLVLSCQPMRKFWQINPDPGNICQPARSMVYVLVVMIPNVLTDLYLLSIPLPLLWAVRIGLRRKITLMALFSGAIFVAVAAIVRAVIVIVAGSNGAVEGSKWACRESFVSIIVANLPIIQPLIRRGASKLGLSALFSNSGPSSYGRGPSGGRRREGDYPLASHDAATGKSKTGTGTETGSGWKSRRLRGFGSTVHHSTAMGSDEEILVDGGRNAGGKGNNQITVTHETVIEREEVSPTGSPTRDGHVVQESGPRGNGGAWDGGVKRG
ncbi:uncharacterized protein APUU_70913S [Aspergillus puulaauensis]|uniref:Rhodopsin domain-containing protein n=1 Tax=Aspergillus puulaauensis TaxID=1220207 RepID=A0A7R7XYT7_9EURO|nr:uncharacterized protein APUU_70913S [Aspergillus puulaauensis]BCS29343.1 hypothetical protein APUU_70913S [Aspergillus puulaauensis]